MQDSQAAVAFLRDPKIIQQYGLDPGRLVVMGHSMGGFLAAKLGAKDPLLMGIAKLGAWTSVTMGPIMASCSKAMFDEEFADMPGRVVGATGRSLVAEAIAHEKVWSLDASAPADQRYSPSA